MPRGCEARTLWLFAYGSLIWKPEVEHVEERVGTARGWHRSFCLRLIRWRGTKEQPGLMMALDRGGQCKGVAYRLVGHTVEAQLGKLFRREMSVKPSTNMPRWIASRYGSRTHSRHRVRGEPKRDRLCRPAHARGDGRHARRGVRSLGLVRRVSLQHRLAP